MMDQGAYLLHVLSGAVAAGLLLIVPLWRIMRRAGFHPAWSLMIFLPYVGLLAVLYLLAFNRWPADPMAREVDG